MSKRTDQVLAAGAVIVGIVVSGILGLWGYMSMTAVPLHPNASAVSSVEASAPQQQWAAPADAARQAVRTALSQQNLPGLSVAVGVDDEIVWAEAFGWADMENKTPLDPSTRLRIGTASIALTSAAAGLLLEKGRLTLDDDIHKWVPEYWSHEWPITLGQLMGHTAGIANDGGDEGALYGRHCSRPVEALQYFSGYERELRFMPGSEYRFSSYGWVLVSAAIEAAADQPLLTFMQRQIFDSLGMRDTGADTSTDAQGERATSYFPRFSADPHYGFHLMRPIDFSCYSGASVFVSTPSDLVRFAMAITGGRLLAPETVTLLQTPQRLPSGADTGYGLGWDVEDVILAGQPARWVGHDGTLLGGQAVVLMTFPDRKLTVAVASNASYTDAEAIGLAIANAFAN